MKPCGPGTVHRRPRLIADRAGFREVGSKFACSCRVIPRIRWLPTLNPLRLGVFRQEDAVNRPQTPDTFTNRSECRASIEPFGAMGPTVSAGVRRAGCARP